MGSKVSKCRCGLFAWLALVLVCGNAAADNGKTGKGEFGIKFGHLGGGTVAYQLKSGTSPKNTIKTESSYSGGAFISQSLWGGLHGAITFDFHYFRAEYEGGETALDVAGGLKYILVNKTRMVSVRPAALLGFAIMPEIWAFKSSKHMTLKLVLELAFHTQKGTGLLLEIGSLRTLSGSDGVYNIKARSMMLLRGGLML